MSFPKPSFIAIERMASNKVSRFDLLYRRFILTKFYTRGWGNPQHIKEVLRIHKLISNRETCYKLVSPNHPVHIDHQKQHEQYTILQGHFTTPVMDVAPSVVPNAVKTARFEMIVPREGATNNYFSLKKVQPVCIHMAGTGDHGFHRRRELMAKPLISHGIASVLLENPFYGTRKPQEQFRSGLLHVNDLFVMGLSLILETLVLLHWLKRTRGEHTPLGLTGISMGGHMASLAATNWPERLAIVPCMSWTSASVVWTEGVLSKAIPWRVLEKQYGDDDTFELVISRLLDGFVDPSNRQMSKDANSSLATTPHGKSNWNRWLSRNRHLTSEQKQTTKSKKLKEQEIQNEIKRRRRSETLLFMRRIMDQVTHLRNYSGPYDPTLATFVIAKQDAYYPHNTLMPMTEVWPGCQVRQIEGGHVTGFLVYHTAFTTAIVDTFKRFVDSSLQKNHDLISQNKSKQNVITNRTENPNTSWNIFASLYRGVFAKS